MSSPRHPATPDAAMVQPGLGGLDTPRTNVGDATYLSRQPDFDISQELSFQSPSKDANLLQQLRNGGRPSLKTPRGSRAPLADRRNLPAGIGGPEFTPLLKSATRNSARRFGSGKENGRATPGFLDKIDEDMTPMPAGETSVYGASRNTSSFMESTPLPVVESSSAASTPLVMKRRDNGRGLLEDGNQLSLREQENVIDRIEKENFGLKLKIHFLEEALRKAGPGFSETVLKENTELKVDKVTMQRELQRYKKHLTSAEKDLESYRQQILEMQEKAKRKYADESQRAELERLRQALEDKETEIDHLQRQLEDQDSEHDKVEKLQGEIGDLEADLRRKDDVITQHEDEIDELRDKVAETEEELRETQQRMAELEEKAQDADRLQEARETIEELEGNVQRLEQQLADMQNKLRDAISQKDRAEAALEAKGQDSDQLREARHTINDLDAKVRRLEQQLDHVQGELQDAISQRDSAQAELEEKAQDVDHLHEEARDAIEHLETNVRRLEQELDDMQDKLREAISQKDRAERELENRAQHVDRLQDEARGAIEDLEANVRRLERELDGTQDKLRDAISQKDRAERDLERRTQHSDRLQEEARQTIEHLEAKVRRLEQQLDNAQDRLRDAISQKDRAEADLEELQEEMANKSVVTKGLSRQVEEKVARLQAELDKARQEAREAAEASEANARRLEQQLHDTRAKLQTAISQRDRAEADLEQLREEMANKTAIIKGSSRQAEEKLARLQAEADKARQEARDTIEGLEANVRRLEQQLRDMNGKLQDAVSQKDRAEADLEELQQEMANRSVVTKGLSRQVEEKVARLQAEVDKARQECMSLEEVRSAQQKEMDEMRIKLKEAREERDSSERLRLSLEEVRSAQEKEMDTLRGRLKEAREERDSAEHHRLLLEARLQEEVSAWQKKVEALEDEVEILQAVIDEEELEAAMRQQETGNTNHSGTAEMTLEERRDLHNMLRESQITADRLDRELREHREALDELLGVESSLRKKLERARSERAAYRTKAEKLQKDLDKLKAEKDKAVAEAASAAAAAAAAAADAERALVRAAKSGSGNEVDTDAIIRAAEAAERRHEKEIRGLVMHMEWLKACWDREARLRTDAAFAKKYLLMQVKVRDEWYAEPSSILMYPSRRKLTIPAVQQQSRPGNHQPNPRRDQALGPVRANPRPAHLLRPPPRARGPHRCRRRGLPLFSSLSCRPPQEAPATAAPDVPPAPRPQRCPLRRPHAGPRPQLGPPRPRPPAPGRPVRRDGARGAHPPDAGRLACRGRKEDRGHDEGGWCGHRWRWAGLARGRFLKELLLVQQFCFYWCFGLSCTARSMRCNAMSVGCLGVGPSWFVG